MTSKFQDLTGQRFGRLVVIKYIGKVKQKSTWLCKCDCGVEKNLITGNLLHNTKSCGCTRYNFTTHKTSEDLTGKIFNRLTVIKKDLERKNHWVCKCQCGNLRSINSYGLRTKYVSCGCYHLEQISGKNHYKWNDSLTPEERDRDRGHRHRNWRSEVFQRDEYRCVLSGFKGAIQSHHLEAWASNPSLRYEESNGITLIKPIHKLYHEIYGKGENTTEEFIEFSERYLSGEFDTKLQKTFELYYLYS